MLDEPLGIEITAVLERHQMCTRLGRSACICKTWTPQEGSPFTQQFRAHQVQMLATWYQTRTPVSV